VFNVRLGFFFLQRNKQKKGYQQKMYILQENPSESTPFTQNMETITVKKKKKNQTSKS
jgi:hypothetical protein